jgi:hypothetical protein
VSQTKKMADKHEAEVALAFGGRVTPGSGGGRIEEHGLDVVTETELIECKATGHLSYSVAKALMNQVERSALLAGKRGLLNIKLDANNPHARRYVVLLEGDYLELASELLDLREMYQRWAEGGMP